MPWLNKLIAAFATLGLGVGVLALVSPIPVGLLIIAINISILLCVSERWRKWVKHARIKSHRINVFMHKIEAKLERRFKRLWHNFVQTRPPEP